MSASTLKYSEYSVLQKWILKGASSFSVSKGLSQTGMLCEDFAHAMGVSVNTVNSWKNGAKIIPAKHRSKAGELLCVDFSAVDQREKALNKAIFRRNIHIANFIRLHMRKMDICNLDLAILLEVADSSVSIWRSTLETSYPPGLKFHYKLSSIFGFGIDVGCFDPAVPDYLAMPTLQDMLMPLRITGAPLPNGYYLDDGTEDVKVASQQTTSTGVPSSKVYKELNSVIKNSNLSIKTISIHTGVSLSTAYSWVKGFKKPNNDQLKALAELVNFQIQEQIQEHEEDCLKPTKSLAEKVRLRKKIAVEQRENAKPKRCINKALLNFLNKRDLRQCMADNIRSYMVASKLSKEQLAVQLGVEPLTIQSWLDGYLLVEPEYRNALASILNTSVDSLFQVEGSNLKSDFDDVLDSIRPDNSFAIKLYYRMYELSLLVDDVARDLSVEQSEVRLWLKGLLVPTKSFMRELKAYLYVDDNWVSKPFLSGDMVLSKQYIPIVEKLYPAEPCTADGYYEHMTAEELYLQHH